MSRTVRILNFLLLLGAAALFAVLNFGERVDLHFGLFTLRSVSLPLVVFGSVLIGMLVQLLVGLRADLRTRKRLRRYRSALEED